MARRARLSVRLWLKDRPTLARAPRFHKNRMPSLFGCIRDTSKPRTAGIIPAIGRDWRLVGALMIRGDAVPDRH